MTSITIKGREIPLIYTVLEMRDVQKEIAPLETLYRVILGQGEGGEGIYGSPEHLDAVVKLTRIMGNAGLEEAGEKQDLTDKGIMRALKPNQLNDIISACLEAMNDGMKSEIPEKEQEGPVDVALEEMKKKDKKDD